jgi:hypothetical protein
MARIVIASLSIADSSAAAQLFTSDLPRVTAVSFKARPGNAAGIYLASDSAAKSSGFELLAGDREDWTFEPPTVKGTSFWAWGADSGDRLDYIVLFED